MPIEACSQLISARDLVVHLESAITHILRFQVRVVNIQVLKATSKDSSMLRLQRSAFPPCTDTALNDVDTRYADNGSTVPTYLCGHVGSNKVWNCTWPRLVSGSVKGGC